MLKFQTVSMLAIVLLFTACGQRAEQKATQEDKAPDEQAAAEREEPPVQAEELIWVYQGRGSKQCEGGGTSLDASAGKLTNNGVTVSDSRCGARTDRMYPAVCGGATGDILLHLINKGSLDAALELGFDPADQIEYQHGSCPETNTR